MILIESVTIKELRGIRDMTLTLDRKPFVIWGPNGSGKSGVVDAIQFAFTGEMARLKGSGTGDVSLTDHGPHVERRNDPDAASVTVNVYIPHLNKSAAITRTIKKHKAPKITPNDADVIAAFEELSEHSEVTLSRREIIKFILAEATKRSQEVQALLKLDVIDVTRATLKTTENKLWTLQTTAKGVFEAAEQSLKAHLDIPALKPEDLLTAVNTRRKLLGLATIDKLEKETDVSAGISEAAGDGGGGLNKETALAELAPLIELSAEGLETPTAAVTETLLKDYAALEADPKLSDLIKRQPLIEDGLDLVDGPQCPLCDTSWDIEKLKAHLRAKLDKSAAAAERRDRIIKAGEALSAAALRLREKFVFVPRLPETDAEVGGRLQHWSGELLAFSESVKTFDGVIAAKARIQAGWTKPPAGLANDVRVIHAKVKARPDRSATEQARSFLVIAQERLEKWRFSRRDFEQKKTHAARSRAMSKVYNDISEKALTTLYESVEKEFGEFYRIVNHDDEGDFTAKLEPSEGKLGLLVDFHKKGMFPPAAYHSEGHQDGMGVCLYLALMKRVLGLKFTFAVLDDVVMSVDSDHRKQFCKLLKTQFPETQFVITTHDGVWAKQIRSEGLVGPKAHVAFQTWSVDTGPVIDEVVEVWDKIDADLARNDVPSAAGKLRRHMEFVSRELADAIGAEVPFRADGGHDMGELLNAVIGRQRTLLKDAAKVANHWNDAAEIVKIKAMQDVRAEVLEEKSLEDWAMNKAIHYNEWAQLTRNDFRDVVGAFKALIQQFRCQNPKCDSWMSLTTRINPAEVRCACGTLRLNLKMK